MKKKRVVVIGAGPAGLTAAYELIKQKKYDVIILEESRDFGGISKTVKYKGNRMDIGGHRFFSKSEKVMKWWSDILTHQSYPSYDDKVLNKNKKFLSGGIDPEKNDEVMLSRDRVSRIFYHDKFFDYPVSMKLDTIKNMGFFTTMLVGFSYLKSVIIKRKENSLEDFYINRFGKKLYNMFFEKYTEKVWGRHPSNISADWGAQRVKGLSIRVMIGDFFKKLFKIKSKKIETSLIENFIYPKYGPGQLWETVAKKIIDGGGIILKEYKVNVINVKDKHIISVLCENGKEIKGDIFMSSMPIKDFILSIHSKVPTKVKEVASNLPYRDFLTVGVLLNKLKLKNTTNIKTINNIIPDCWLYIQDDRVKLGRIQIFNNWSPYMVKDINKKVWIGLEYFCNEGDSLWSLDSKKIKRFVGKELKIIGLIDSEKDIIDYHVERVKKAYPAYFDSYYQFEVVKKYINSFDNLYCIGRNGQHKYNNMDHSMLTSFYAVDLINGKIKDKKHLWDINSEKEFHEVVNKFKN